MNVFILQKSITDLKAPIKRVPFETGAKTLGEFICEMVEKNTKTRKTSLDYIELFDALTETGGTMYSYGRERKKFSVDEMKKFALDAFRDKIYIVKNTTKNISYTDLEQDCGFTENDEIVLIKLKYVRGAI